MGRPTGRNIVHGNSSTYTNCKCRCELCKAAWAKRMLDYNNRRKSTGDKRINGRWRQYRKRNN